MSFKEGEISNLVGDIRAFGSPDGIIIKYVDLPLTNPIPMNMEFLNALLDLENPDSEEGSTPWWEGWWWKT